MNNFESAIATALEPITSTMEADGYGVQLQGDAEELTVRITATETACADCLAPRKVIEPMIETLMGDHGLKADTLTLIYPTEGH